MQVQAASVPAVKRTLFLIRACCLVIPPVLYPNIGQARGDRRQLLYN